jgi:hypothetical protein
LSIHEDFLRGSQLYFLRLFLLLQTILHLWRRFVLARNVSKFMDKYNRNVTDYLTEQGFTDILNSPILTPQNGCDYWI